MQKIMNIPLFNKLHAEGLVSDESLGKIKAKAANPLFSVHWELKTLLYLGVLLLSGGLGILVYKNIDTIGHQAILAFIALVSGGCYYYCFKHKAPFANFKAASPNGFFDYILLLGSLTFVSFVAYLQYQYNVFGNRYGLATFIPMVVLFVTAYYFDHLGILSLAITNLAAWFGLTVTPMHMLEANDFDDSRIIFTGLALGVLLIAAAYASQQRSFKAHFAFTYDNFGIHLMLLSSLAAMFHFEEQYLLWFLLFAGLVFFSYQKAMRQKSFYFLLITTLYAYVGISYVVVRLLWYGSSDIGPVYIGLLYFISSGLGLIVFLIRSNKKLKA